MFLEHCGLFLLTLSLLSCNNPDFTRHEPTLAYEKDAEPDLLVEISDEEENLLLPLPEDISEDAIRSNKCYAHAAMAFLYRLGINGSYMEEVEQTFLEKGVASTSKQYWDKLQGAILTAGGTLDLEVIHPIKRLASRFALEKERATDTNPDTKAGSQQDSNEFLFDILLMGKKDRPKHINAEEKLKVTRVFEKPTFPLEPFRFKIWQLAPESGQLEALEASGELSALKAMLVHYGSPECGHWVTYLKEQEQWYKVDDSRVEVVSFETVKRDFLHAELALF